MFTWEIVYRGEGGASFAHGRTPSEAKYNKFLDVDDCFETFRDFLLEIRSVKKTVAPATTYDFIERQYGQQFIVGQRVVIDDCGTSKKEFGEVVYPRGGGSYVSILLDNSKQVGLFHPGSISQTQGD